MLHISSKQVVTLRNLCWKLLTHSALSAVIVAEFFCHFQGKCHLHWLFICKFPDEYSSTLSSISRLAYKICAALGRVFASVIVQNKNALVEVTAPFVNNVRTWMGVFFSLNSGVNERKARSPLRAGFLRFHIRRETRTALNKSHSELIRKYVTAHDTCPRWISVYIPQTRNSDHVTVWIIH